MNVRQDKFAIKSWWDILKLVTVTDCTIGLGLFYIIIIIVSISLFIDTRKSIVYYILAVLTSHQLACHPCIIIIHPGQ